MIPLFILYSILVSSVFIFLLGIWVWRKNPSSVLYKIFLLLSIDSAGLFFGSYMMLKNCKTSLARVIFWDRFLYIFVVFIPVIVYHFVLAISGCLSKKKYRNLLYLGYFLSFLFLILSRTDYFVKDVFQYQWGCHTIAQIGHHIFLIFFMIYVILFFHLLVKSIFEQKDEFRKTQMKYVLVAILFYFLMAGAFLSAYKIGIYPFYYIGPLLFVTILAYAITRFHLLDVRVIAVEILVLIILVIFLTQILLSNSFGEVVARGLLFILMAIFGNLVIKSINREVHQKEILEREVRKRTEELEKAKDLAQQRAKEAEERKKELERFYELTVGRELKMIELKQKIKELEKKVQEKK